MTPLGMTCGFLIDGAARRPHSAVGLTPLPAKADERRKWRRLRDRVREWVEWVVFMVLPV